MKAQGGETWHSSALKPQHMLPKTEPVRASGHSDLDLRTRRHAHAHAHTQARTKMHFQIHFLKHDRKSNAHVESRHLRAKQKHVLAGYTAYKSPMTLKLMCRMKVCRHTEKLHCAMTNSSTAYIQNVSTLRQRGCIFMPQVDAHMLIGANPSQK